MRWTLKPKPDPSITNALADSLTISPIIAGLLVQRGVDTFDKAKAFFRPNLDQLHDPFLMKDMDKAVTRIDQAIATHENILVYGDYDVDGTTSVALMSSFLKTLTPQVDTYIPDRYQEGYGVSFQGIDYAHDNGITLIIALDCGIKAIDKVAYAQSKGIDFIICDHHRPGATLPNAIATLDPKREDCPYPYKELCGCGVGFKLITAITLSRKLPQQHLHLYLDLVATAIGADIVPITGENRILAFYGMQVINKAPRPGFEAIIKQTQKTNLSITDVVFTIAPRINAAGRMKHGNHAVQLLTETNLNTATQFAKEIESYNNDRKETDKKITAEALAQITANNEEDNCTTVVFQPDWHKGVIGIVASRLIETYYRPTLVFTQSGDMLAASARSVKGFDVYNALEACKKHIEQFGGHKYAAGLTLKPKNYNAFKDCFEKVVKETCDKHLLAPEITIDTAITINEITPKFYRILNQFSPFGPGNMSPVFMSDHLKDTGFGKQVGQDQSHLKLKVKQDASTAIDAIGFNLGDRLAQTKQPFSAAYAINENEWNGNTTLQLMLKDIK